MFGFLRRSFKPAAKRRMPALFEAVEHRRLMAASPFVSPATSAAALTPDAVFATSRSSSQSVSNEAVARPWAGNKSGDKMPIFDFTDAYYRKNGIDPTKIVGRPSGTGNSVIDNRVNDPTRRNVRIKQAVGSFDENGDAVLFSVLGLIKADAFLNNSAGQKAREIADKFIIYMFPRQATGPVSFPKRQDDVVPLNHGYFSNDPLGTWRMVFVNYVSGSMNSGEGKRVADDLVRRNGRDTDGTPMLRSEDDIEDAVDAGIVTLRKRKADGSEGQPWFFCPVYKDTREGAIQPDATLAVVRNPDGTTHATSLPIERLFNNAIADQVL
jgi:hypothetical protein